VTQALLRLMAPILSFTAEEAWEVLNPGKDESIFFHTWKDMLPPQQGEPELLARWKRLREIRAAVVRQLEASRASGEIGSSLQAEIEVGVHGADLELLKSLGDDLKFVMITSQASAFDLQAVGDPMVKVRASDSPKCERCWHWRADVGADPRHASICARCVANLEGPGEVRRHA
jgi:isoleucyl-tRNA synthetase